MLTINTNLSSLIAQGSIKSSTNKLNQAIERMTTGFKINHAKDNAANYAISTNMTTKISSLDVAEDNAAMGLDLISTAEGVISQMYDHATRLRALSIQASNGTYGAQSLEAINSEADARIAEIMRLYNTAEYNGVELFNRKSYTIDSSLPQAGESGFINETAVDIKPEYNGFIADPVTYTDEQIEQMLANNEIKALDDSVTSFTSGQKYLISDNAELKRLAKLVNSGQDSTGAIFILGADIDLGGEEWTSIGNSTNLFKGSFDGNGHKIKNLKIDNQTTPYLGLFGATECAAFKNVAVIDCDIKAKSQVGALVGRAPGSTVINCYSSGNIKGTYYVGGLIGWGHDGSYVESCYSLADVRATDDCAGGLIGQLHASDIKNCYALGNVKGGALAAGGLIGLTNGNITNCYATGNVSGNVRVGGLVGAQGVASIIDSYATGNVTGIERVGGLAGTSQNVVNSYATGNVDGVYMVAGLSGAADNSITRSYSTGQVNGESFVGGLAGFVWSSTKETSFSDNAVYGTVSAADLTSAGSFLGVVQNTSDGVNYRNVDISNNQVIKQDLSPIGACCKSVTDFVDYDMSTWLSGISEVIPIKIQTSLQIGIKSDLSSQISFDTNFALDISVLERSVSSPEALTRIDEFINLLSAKSTQLGAVQNRLESVLEEITIQRDNLISSRSTIRDADIAEVSSHYIQQQILQQASATLLATANQSPSIALQLI